MHKIRQALVMTIVLSLLGMATVADAQWSRWARRDDRQASQILARIEQRTVRFKNSAQQAMSQSSMYNTQKEDRLDRLVNDFQQSVMDLRSRYNRNQATSTDVQALLDRAQRIDRFMQRRQLSSNAVNDWQLLRGDLDQLASAYNIAWDWNRDDLRGVDGNALLSGTFQLNTAQSDDARLIVERAVRDLPYSERQRISESLLRRIDAPDMLAIDRQGRTIMLASSRMPQMTFEANGQQSIDRYPNSQANSRVIATLAGDQLTLNSSGDRATDFSITFDPINNGRQLRVTRRLYSDRLSQPVIVQSIYDQVSPTARWDVYNGSSNSAYDRGAAARLSGTFRLNPAQSDDARVIVERTVRDLPYSDRQRISDALLRRLEAPDMLAIDRQGRTIMLASSKVPQLTFEADGIEHVETYPNSNRTSRVTASLTGDTLTINSTGDRATDFSVTFDPINNGRQMRVTRRLYSERLNQPIVVQSTYDQESPTARWDIYNGPAYGDNRYGPDRSGNYNSGYEYVIPDNMLIVGRLNETLDTTQARAGDRFTMTVVSPPEYRDAVIEGHVGDVNRSGRLTGRAELVLAFDTIRMRDGRIGRFDGTLDSVRATNGDTLRVDTEGTVRDDSSQTTRTTTRAAIGAGVGALIGAIAGGGKGAVIGAVLGGGAGAGSVFVQGRNDLQLTPGTEITIRVSSPNRRAM